MLKYKWFSIITYICIKVCENFSVVLMKLLTVGVKFTFKTNSGISEFLIQTPYSKKHEFPMLIFGSQKVTGFIDGITSAQISKRLAVVFHTESFVQ